MNSPQDRLTLRFDATTSLAYARANLVVADACARHAARAACNRVVVLE